MKHPAIRVAIALIAGALSTTALAAGGHVHKEIATALIHANVAAKVDNLAGVHLHLHHVVNCVAGPRSENYSAKAEALSGYPCKGLGNGALVDAGRDSATGRALEQVVSAAERGIHAQKYANAHNDATAVLRELRVAQQASEKGSAR